jgi:hypothetical protein
MSGETLKLVKVEEIELRQLRRNKSRVRPQSQNLPEQVQDKAQKSAIIFLKLKT